jgi:CubicO group peptidase (beta-lactamase class C family)
MLPAIVFKGEAGKPAGIAARMRHHKVPGLSLAVIEDGRVQWARGYGVTAAEGKVAVTPKTLFQAGAVSKPVAAMAALLLVQEGRLDLDADVNTRLVAWKVPENQFTATQKVTLRRLLSHTAGVTVDGFPGYPAGQPVPTLAQVLDGTGPARTPAIGVDRVPGSAFRQSGGGYVIVQQLLTDVTGEAFPRLMERTVLSRLEMSGSTYEQPLPAERAAGAASGQQPGGAAVEGGWRGISRTGSRRTVDDSVRPGTVRDRGSCCRRCCRPGRRGTGSSAPVAHDGAANADAAGEQRRLGPLHRRRGGGRALQPRRPKRGV